MSYYFFARQEETPLISIVMAVTTILVVLFIIVVDKKRDIIDESGRESIRKSDHICLKLFYLGTAPILISIMFWNDAILTGYIVVSEFVLFTAIRIILFWIYDSRGVE
ncbi:MAG: hypothetical protein FWC62_01735 [Firmicutes bacterium]|nr:hypothetical protein [Bacillota bacterium]